jgi:hypothetical protein
MQDMHFRQHNVSKAMICDIFTVRFIPQDKAGGVPTK